MTTSHIKPTLSHIGINLSHEEISFPFWKDLLTYLDFTLTLDGNHFDASDGHSFLCFSTTKPDYSRSTFHRKHTGLNHIAFSVPSSEAVDEFVADYLTPRDIHPLYGGAN